MALKFAPIENRPDMDGISLPIEGKDYVIPPPDIRTGMEVAQLMGLAIDASQGRDIADSRVARVVAASEEAGGQLERRVLGPALDEMIADKVPWPVVRFAFQTAVIWIWQDATVAARYWGSGSGSAMAEPAQPTRASRRATAAKRAVKEG